MCNNNVLHPKQVQNFIRNHRTAQVHIVQCTMQQKTLKHDQVTTLKTNITNKL
jgi:hypothetical protein